MGQLIYSMIVSLDGYVADPEGNFEWATPDEEVLAAVNEDTARVRTFLYGRTMYQMMHCWETDPAIQTQSPKSEEFAAEWMAADKIVYSTTLGSADIVTERTQLRSTFDVDEVRALKDHSSTDLTVDGPTLAAHALEAGLVDQLHLLVCPVSIGGGLRYLPDGLRLDLRLVGEHRFSAGVVQLKYAIT